ncbi:MAG: hypothetical protein KDA42_14440 [Planctomycetales bacterium]|nr:hypothetical protein [Planctomycetales bacterium]
MKRLTDYLVALMAPVAVVGHGAGGVRRRRSIGNIATKPKRGNSLLNWTVDACYDRDVQAPLEARLRLAMVPRG